MLYEALIKREKKLAVVGLGYVGLPIATAFSRKLSVVGFDVNREKVGQYKKGNDPTREVGAEAVRKCSVQFTSDEQDLQEALFFIVAVPTPVNASHIPDLKFVKDACSVVARNLKAGAVVVFESTVYPGVTEDICAPILESESGLKCGTDFKIGYSPERINPGDKAHRLENIVKIVSGMDAETLDLVASVYSLVVEAGVYRAGSIRIAEAAKVIENSQRDINVAFMNELSIILNRIGLDSKEVLSAASTKWNFLNFAPGLVGGHCIGVDPYYLTYLSEQVGYHSQIILAARRVNDDMGRYVAQNIVKKLIEADIAVKNARVAVFGLTFKENCPDTRNTKVMDIVAELREYGVKPIICDPVADARSANKEYGVELVPLSDIRNVDAVVFAVAHKQFAEFAKTDIDGFFGRGDRKKVLIDVKGIFNRSSFEAEDYIYWRL